MRTVRSRAWPLVALLGALACGKAEAPAPAPGAEATAAAPAPSAPPTEAPVAPPAPESVDPAGEIKMQFGLDVASDGTVATPVLAFARGDQVCAAVSAAAAAPGAIVTLRWFDARGDELGEVSGALAGAPPRAGLCLPGSAGLDLGTYSMDIQLDGRDVGSAQFTIGELREAVRSGGA